VSWAGVSTVTGLLPMPCDVDADVRQFFEEKVNLVAALAFLQAIVAQFLPDQFDVDADLVAVAGTKVDTGVGVSKSSVGLPVTG